MVKNLYIFVFLCFLVFLFFSFFVFEAEAGVVLKVIAVNPSKEQEQTAAVKAYLPREVKPEDIIDKGDLDMVYDTQQGSYYVFGDYTLKPGEVLEKDIEIRDIWVIPDAEIESLGLEAVKIGNVLKTTEFADRISFLINSIESKLNQVRENQKSSPPNPERHISDYRDNLKIMESVKTDMVLARSFFAQAKGMPTVKIWRMILGIIIFLGLLGLSFYFIWHKQVKAITQDTFYVPPGDEAAAPKRHEAGEEKPAEAEDIEKIIKKEE